MRAEFKRYDHRRYGPPKSRGWLSFLGIRRYLLVVGFHRMSRDFRPSRAWMEFTLYTPWNGMGWSVYPGIRIPQRWT